MFNERLIVSERPTDGEMLTTSEKRLIRRLLNEALQQNLYDSGK